MAVKSRRKRSSPRVQFKPYLRYEDTGVEWLREIPTHWKVAPVYSRYEVALGKMLDARRVTGEFLGHYLRNVDVQWDAINAEGLPEMDFAPWERHRYLLRPGDLLICEGGEVGRTAIWRGDINECYYQKAIHRVRPHSDSDEPRFFYYLMRFLASSGILVAGGNPNTIDHLTAVQLRHYSVPFPPLSEQRAIMVFLDRKTAAIDALAKKKERLIELLQEKRSILITRAVTKGIGSSCPMKDCGIQWLDEIPAHWQMKPLKTVSELQTGLTLGKRFEGQRMTTRPYLRVANVQDGYLALDDIAEVALPSQDATRHELRKGDVLITEGGDFDKLGRGHVWEGQIAGCLHQNHIFAVRPRRSALRPYFLAHVLSSGYGRAYFTATSKQSTNLASTNSTKLRNFPVPLPSLAEQDEIVLSIGRDTKHVDALITRVRDAIGRLNELRSALISAAVTGKIDVREAAS